MTSETQDQIFRLGAVGGARSKSPAHSLIRSVENYIHNEVLCYLSNKIDILSHDLIVKIVSEFYSDEEIEKAKTVLYDSCTVDGRLKFRKGQKKRQANVTDMLSVIHEIEPSVLPRFFALDLSRLPPLDMQSVDVTGMMQEIKQIKTDAVTTTTVTKLTDDVEALRVQMSELMNVVTKQLQQSESNAQVQSSLPNSYATAAKSGANVSNCHQMKGSSNNPTPRKLPVPPVKPVKSVDTGLRPSSVPAAESTLLQSNQKQLKPDNSDEFKLVESKKRRRNFIVGTSSINPSDLACRKRQMSLFITRLQPEVTDSQVIEYIKTTFKTECSCEKLKTKFDSYSSFKVDVICDNFDKFFECENWPENVLVRKYFKSRKEQ